MKSTKKKIFYTGNHHMQSKHVLYLITITALIITAVSAGGYAPIPYDPFEHQTAAQAEAIAGALVGFRGTYSTPAQFTPITNRAAPIYYPLYENGLIIYDGTQIYDVISNRCHV